MSKSLFINGDWVKPIDGGTREILNPATNDVVATVDDGSEKDVQRAIDAARKAFDEGPWPQMRVPSA